MAIRKKGRDIKYAYRIFTIYKIDGGQGSDVLNNIKPYITMLKS